MQRNVVILVEGVAPTRILCRMLLQEAGYRVLEAPSPEDAIRLARKEEPSAILLEPAPGSSRVAGALRLLRQDPRTARIPLVLVAAPHQAERVSAEAQAGVRLIPTPCPARRIVEAVLQVIAERASLEPRSDPIP